MLALADEKKCWLADLDEIPAVELNYWLAFYDLKKEELDRAQARHGVGRRR